jgi:hypothetical protein
MKGVASPAERIATVDAFELGTVLARLGISQYEECLHENGFENWEEATLITEPDLAELGFKLGDRRKLQRAIREYKGSTASESGSSGSNVSPLYEQQPGDAEQPETTSATSSQAARTIRPYRRHARPDPNAPPKPKTAYVHFSEYVRQDPALSNFSFADIAKETGKRWRELPSDERVNTWETPAADKLRVYKEELELYKQTENYRKYQAYLEGFKQRRANPESIGLGDKDISASEPDSAGQFHNKEDLEMEDLEPESQLQEATSTVESGMAEVRRISQALGIDSYLTRFAALPPKDVTTRAVEAFSNGTGLLLFLWDRDEALDLVQAVYSPEMDSKPVYEAEIFAMSAVGSYCDAEGPIVLFRERFLQFFLHVLSSISDMCHFRLMRLFACLAICRFTNSVESARKLMCE